MPSFTKKSLAEYRNKRGMFEIAPLGDGTPMFCPVYVKDAKGTFGVVRLLITPVNGHGQQWVVASKVTIMRG